MILGAILAGGRARRFGGDKAAAEIGGVALIERVATALRPQCDRLVVVGRDWLGLTGIDDWPRTGLGPLGGLAGALRYAKALDHYQVVTSGCDLPDIPQDLAARLAPAPAVVADQPLLGLWSVHLLDQLVAHLANDPKRSMRGWIAASGAREVAWPEPLANINTREELARYEDGRGAWRAFDAIRPAGRRSSR